MATDEIPERGAIVTKDCPGCGINKPIADFGFRRQSPDGLKPRCRDCRNAYTRNAYYKDLTKSRAENSEKRMRLYRADPKAGAAKAKAYRDSRKVEKPKPTDEELAAIAAISLQKKHAARKRTYEKNKEKVLAVAAAYREAHKAEEHANRAAHYQRNKAHVAEVTKAYRIAHPELYACAFAKRRATKRNATPAWADMDAIARIYEECARISQETGVPHEVDHIVPLQGKNVCGLHCEANLQIITAFANRSKANKWAMAA